MTAAVKVRYKECARCGLRQPVKQMVRSWSSGLRFCANVDECAARAKRKPPRETAA